MPWKTNTEFQRLHYLTILPNTSCNLYCNNTLEDSNVDHKFQCGSLTEPRIWAIYDLNGTCPKDFVYIRELKKCMYTYKNVWNSCTLPSKSYVYDDSITWNNFLKIIQILNLNESVVTVDFAENVVINSSWKCSTTSTSRDLSFSYNSHSYSSLYSWNSNTRYLLENGCLRDSSYSSYSQRYSYRLCITNPINKYSLDDDDDDEINSTFSINLQINYCPTSWFDLNGRCYRMSDERKTIQDAKTSCITISKSETTNTDSDEDDDNDQLNDSPKGNIVQYTSEWQTRLGFFLLDTVPETGKESC
jgi:hypothetical protein